MNKESFKRSLWMVLMAALGGLISLGTYKLLGSEKAEKSYSSELKFIEKPTVIPTSFVGPDGAASDFTAAATITTPTVVHIKSLYKVQANYRSLFDFPDPFEEFFGEGYGYPRRGNIPGQPQLAQSSGSGVIISTDGYIVTNNHVIENAEEIEVVMSDKRSYAATLIGTDPSTDLALLKVEENGLQAIAFGNSDDVRVGEWVLAVGNPFNLSSTVTAGIVSAKGRDIDILTDRYAIESFIQTDAAVNPGNSGGALVNAKGELIGINTAIASTTGAYAGYAFAIPSEIVRKVITDLKKYGTVQRGYIGVNILELNGEVARKFNLNETQGVLIEAVKPGGPAEESGLKEGDIIKKIDGKSIRNSAEFSEFLGRKRPGEKVTIQISRDGRPLERSVTLKNQKGTTDVIKNNPDEVLEKLGAEFETLSQNELAEYRLSGGVRISHLSREGVLYQQGIKEGFIITKIDRQEVSSAKEIGRILQNKRGGVMIEGIYPDQPGVYYYAFGI